MKQQIIQLNRYLVFYEIHGDTASAEVMGKNVEDMKRRFKNIYGGWKIIHYQKLKG